MRCELCETENPDDAAECAGCGKQLHSDARLFEEVAPLAGLEETLRDPLESAGPVETLPELERTQLEADPRAPSNWTAGNVELDTGRELDLSPRTEAPQASGACPWCGVSGEGAVCDACGRRKSRYTTAAAAVEVEASGDATVLCPACFSRVPPGPRCGECGVPFGAREN